MRVAVFGLGYVGCVTAACLAADGHDVCGIDVDDAKVAQLAAGEPPVLEPGLGDRIAVGLAEGRLTTTTDVEVALSGTDVALICVGTPSRHTGAVELRFLAHVVQQVADFFVRHPAAVSRLTVVVRSTVPPGTTRATVHAPLVERLTEAGFTEAPRTAFCPEFLRESSAITDFYNPPFSVFGTDSPEVVETLGVLFSAVDAVARPTTLEVAEMLKYACNAYHALKVGFANEIGRLSDALDFDGRAVMDLFVEDTTLNVSRSYLRPGFAFGGSCLPKDLRALSHLGARADVALPVLDAVLESNDVQVQRLLRHVAELGWQKIAVVGITFKNGTDDLRESPFVTVVESLVGRGATVSIHDPNVDYDRLVGANRRLVDARLRHLASMLKADLTEALEGVDGVIIGSQPAEVGRTLRAQGHAVLDAQDPATLWPSRVEA